MDSDELQKRLRCLPREPGVYIFQDSQGDPLYIGKASSLRSRVRSYFQSNTGDKRAFIPFLEHEMHGLETIVVANEKEAALLESMLIKEQQPKYNIKLKDDKSFLSLRLDPHEAWPRLRLVRRTDDDRAFYFGPYPSAMAAYQTTRLIQRHFQLRTCTDAEMKRRTRPCLQHQIHRCPAPCVLDVEREEYGKSVEHVKMFLQGKYNALEHTLEHTMKEAAANLDFERAAQYRDGLAAIRVVRERQRIVTPTSKDQDVIGLFRLGDLVELSLLQTRAGNIIRMQSHGMKHGHLPDGEVISAFLRHLYLQHPAPNPEIPDDILIPTTIEAMEGMAALLGEHRGRRVRIRVPRKGPPSELLRMAMDNAAHAFREKARSQANAEETLLDLAQTLDLDEAPAVIECVDISHTQGSDPVAVFVSMRDGALDGAGYRSFSVKTARGGDDYASIHEVVLRRLKRAKEARWTLPDMLLIDGGKGQLNMALAAAEDAACQGLTILSIAKERTNAAGEALSDRIYRPGQKNPIPVHKHPSLRLLVQLRDEAHRASNALRVRRRSKRTQRSILEDIPGIGLTSRNKLLQHFLSANAAITASPEDLARAGISRKQVAAILAHRRASKADTTKTS